LCIAGQANSANAVDYYLGTMKANKILFLGNSITSCYPNMYGLHASEESKDYVHLLTNKINTTTGGNLALSLMDDTVWVDGELQPGTANVLNIAHIFERNYRTYSASKLQYQIDAQPNIVVMEFGENVDMSETAFNADVFESKLREMVGDFQSSSDPVFFFTSMILGSNSTIDGIKQKIVSEDPMHRVFVDMSAISANAATYITSVDNHPNDAGMALIANNLYSAMETYAVPEPSSVVLLSVAAVGLLGYAWKHRKVTA
jgi:hypothetical protein